MKNKSYYCEKLEQSLNILPDRIAFCCSCAEGCHIKINDVNNLNLDCIQNRRNEYISQMKKGIIPNECSGCYEYKERPRENFFKRFFEFNKNKKINYIILNHFKQCECNCVYCAQKILYPDINQKFEILPVIKELYKKGLIDKNYLKVEFQGGNVSMLKEFDVLIDEFNANRANEYVVLTNGIKELPALAKIQNTDNCMVSISLDCGTKETFKKIKNIDAFDRVAENIEKIMADTKFRVALKYIILENINDNMEELSAFLNLAKTLKVNGEISLEIDYRKLFMNSPERFKIPEIYYKMFEFAEKYCAENNLTYKILPYTKQVLDKGYNF